MDKTMKNNNDEIEIDLGRIGAALLRKAWLIALAAVICAGSAFLFTKLFITPQYKSSAMLYVNNSTARGENYSSITAADINASRGLVKSYLAILNTRETMEEIADYAQVDLSYVQIQQMISAGSVDSTEIMEVVVTADDPVLAQKIADAVTSVLPRRISSIIDGTSTKIVAAATLPQRPASPNNSKNTLIGFLAGFVLAAAVVVLQAILDVRIHSEEDVEQLCDYPILATVPDMVENTSGSKYLGKGDLKNQTGKYAPKENQRTGLVGAEISFPAAEAYKLLRTKLQFSFTEENNCRVIGICSALSGEGKSLSAINLAYSVAQLGNRVLLIDCDMRRPSISKKLHVNNANGLSNFLSVQSQAGNLIQMCGLPGEEQAFHVIAAGRTPPNPVELLSSARMKKLLTLLREKYQYIILDLPPISEVSDALAVTGQTDGVILVVRQDFCDRKALSSAVRQFEFVDAKILGVVLNCAEEETGIYGNAQMRKMYENAYLSAAKKAARKRKK